MSSTEADPFDALEELLVHPSAENAQALWVALPPKLRLAMAKAAPRVAGKWRQEYQDHRRMCGDRPVATIHDWNKWNGSGCTGSVGAVTIKTATPQAAKSACDAELIRQGFVLDDGGET